MSKTPQQDRYGYFKVYNEIGGGRSSSPYQMAKHWSTQTDTVVHCQSCMYDVCTLYMVVFSRSEMMVADVSDYR